MSDKKKAELEAELAELHKAKDESDARADAAEAKLAKVPASPKQAGGETPRWQSPDYTGPLSIEQSSWRHANIKPAAAKGAK